MPLIYYFLPTPKGDINLMVVLWAMPSLARENLVCAIDNINQLASTTFREDDLQNHWQG